MLLIVTNQYDYTADAVAALWGRRDVRIMRPLDLSVCGWSYRPGEVESSRFVAGGTSAGAGEVTGVLTRMACVFESDLGHIHPADRCYVASEMTALLLAWLTELSVPVINRPTATCLCGPLWSQERWLNEASKLGIPVLESRRCVGPPDGSPPQSSLQDNESAQMRASRFTVVDGVAIGAPTPDCENLAQRLSDYADCRLLSVHVRDGGSGYALAGVDVWPEITPPAVADALLSALDGPVRVGAPR
jgi:hypothetical protein